ncbi:hypothetical protein AB0B63_07190 [Micromonospora sp. NPDC049081]|uniref:hypothetical protein n=1 Tax=Micromonospora sp. NPDC049081 TaxID=3155150 RepID=UPI0033DF6C46
MTDDARPTFLDRQRDAALQQIRDQQTEFRRIADIVLPTRPGALRSSRKRVTDVITLGADHLVEVTDGDTVLWTFVIDGKPTSWRHHTQEEAILHLIASRHDSNDSASANAAFYAGRVLGIPAAEA